MRFELLALVCLAIVTTSSADVNDKNATIAESNTELIRHYRRLKRTTTTRTTRAPTSSANNSKRCAMCACGIANGRNRIVGGHETLVHEYPWMAMLTYNGRFYCGGSLINDRYVLTAAHCVRGMSRTSIGVRLLAHNNTGSNSNSGAIERKIAAVTIHPNFNTRTFNNDIALLRLDNNVELNSPLRPVCLPSGSSTYAGQRGIVTGWGSTSEKGPVASSLLEVSVPIISNQQCRRQGVDITNTMLCAGESSGGKDACQGDSGGPLHVVQGSIYEQVGVVSWGEGCARPNRPGVYTRVSSYIPWIRSNTADACYC